MSMKPITLGNLTKAIERLKGYFLQIKDAVKTVNLTGPDQNGDIQIDRVDFAGELESSTTTSSTEEFKERTTAEAAPVEDGDAWLLSVSGNRVHTGTVEEVLDWEVVAIERSNPITATLNEDTFRAYVQDSAEITLTFTTAWSEDPTLYGFTITGTPAAGDQIVISYTKQRLGTITTANPQTFTSTGWNLYNHTAGYAKVVRYSDTYGYRIEGTYTAVQFSATETGIKTTITPDNGAFNVPSNGYVWVTGGNSSNTAVYLTWRDWTEGTPETFEAYNSTTISLAEALSLYFPYGLCRVGTSRDEINLSLGTTIRRIDRMANTAANMETAIQSGREYEADENYIYIVLATPETNTIEIDGSYTCSDHGTEYFTETTVPVLTQTLYGSSLRNKLEVDVLTSSQQDLTPAQQMQARYNIGAADAPTVSDLAERLDGFETAAWTASSSTYIDVEPNTRYLVMATSGATTHQGLWLVSGLQSSAEVMTIQAGERITVSVSGMRITWTHSQSRATRYSRIKFNA